MLALTSRAALCLVLKLWRLNLTPPGASLGRGYRAWLSPEKRRKPGPVFRNASGRLLLPLPLLSCSEPQGRALRGEVSPRRPLRALPLSAAGITVLLSLTVFMLLVAEIMPATSDSVPLIGEASRHGHGAGRRGSAVGPCLPVTSGAVAAAHLGPGEGVGEPALQFGSKTQTRAPFLPHSPSSRLFWRFRGQRL